MWGVKKKGYGSRKREIPFCARSEVGKIKYPRTCPIHTGILCADVISGALTEIWYMAHRFALYLVLYFTSIVSKIKCSGEAD
jgi:hypothetical protein